MAAPYILAHRLSDAHRFAQDELGAARGYYRIVTSPGSIKGPVGADLFLVPGWERRYDRFSMKTALKFTRLNVIDVEEWRREQAEEPADGPTERDLEVAYRYNALRDASQEEEPNGEPDGLDPLGEQITIEDADGMLTAMGRRDPEIADLVAEPTESDAQAEEPKRRRRRCKECGVLVDPDDLESHAAEHLPVEEE